jgi:hypothetical protein
VYRTGLGVAPLRRGSRSVLGARGHVDRFAGHLEHPIALGLLVGGLLVVVVGALVHLREALVVDGRARGALRLARADRGLRDGGDGGRDRVRG